MRPINVKLFDTLERGREPLADMAINPNITAIRLTHTLPAGPNTLEVGIVAPEMRAGWGESYGFLPEPIGTKAFAHVEVSIGGTVVWEGRLLEDEIGPYGAQAFVADGYGLAASNNDVYLSTDPTITTTGDVISSILTAAAPLLSRGTSDEWIDPQVSHARLDFSEMTLAEALDQVLSEGGSGYVTWDWWVTIGRRLVLKPRSSPVEPDYLIPFRVGETSIRRNYRDICTTAYVSYTEGQVEFQTPQETRDATVTAYRINRRVRIAGDELTAAAATQLRSMELERRSGPEVSITIDRGPDDWLTTPSGIGVPHWGVTAGQWVQIADYDPQVIISASYDPQQGLSLDLGAPSRQSFAVYLANTCTEVNKLVKGINPVTGGRRRGIRQSTDLGAASTASFADVNTYLNNLRSKMQTEWQFTS